MAQQESEEKTDNSLKPKFNSILNGITAFNKSKLKETETVVRHIVGIVDRGKGAGPDSALNEEEIKEYYDSPDILQQKAQKLANLIASSKYVVVHTGAGISTAAKLPDYRGPQGVWTLRAKGYE